MADLKDKRIIITGAGSGIGRATALLLALTMNSHRATAVKDASADRPASNETASTIPGAAPVTTPPATRPVVPKPPTTTVKSKPAKRQLESGEIDLRAY